MVRVQQVASYRTSEGRIKQIVWDDGRFFVDGYELSLGQVLEWDSAGLLAWVSPETQAWARGLASYGSGPSGGAPAADEPGSVQPAEQQAAAGSREALLADIMSTFSQHAGYIARYGTDTDITLESKVAEASWGTGKKKVEYSARMRADEASRTLYFFEVLKERGSGLNFGGFTAETYTIKGAKRSGSVKETIIGPNGIAMDYDWDYGRTREVIESICTRHGWRLKVVLRPKSASY